MYSPRIYLYKITFEEVPYYYYGIHKEKRYNEYYMGSPITNKWCWQLYTPKKQILEIFDYTDEGWLEANQVEQRVIRPVYNTDKWCLNENCGGIISIEIMRENGKKSYEKGLSKITTKERKEIGKKSGKKLHQLGLGIHSLTIEDRKKLGERTGKENYKLGRGWFAISKEERIKISSKSGNITYEQGIGIHGQSKEKMTENGKKGGKISGQKTYEQGIGIHGQSKEKMTENGKKGVKIVNSQKWMCLETGYVSTAAGVVSHQKGRRIDTSKSNRKRIS